MDENELITLIKWNKILLNEHFKHKIAEIIENKVNLENVAACFHSANLFQLPDLYEFTLRYIERCFTMISETTGFLQLGYTQVVTILSSSELHVSSEAEVFSAADQWIDYDFSNRKKFAENILLRVRFPLLSQAVLKSIFSNPSSFHKIR